MTLFVGRPELLVRFRAGDRAALEEVYWAYVDRVETIVRGGFARVARADAQSAPDVVQECFVRAFSDGARLGFDGLREYGPFISMIARHALADWWRRNHRLAPVADLEALVEGAAGAQAAADAEVVFADAEIVREVERYLGTLDAELRAVHEQLYVLGRPQREDERGSPLVAMHAEAATPFSLLLPAGRELFVTAPDGREATVRLGAGETLAGSALAWKVPDLRARSALGSALDRGLFAMPFGPAYYRGFVDGQPELMAVPLVRAAPVDAGPAPTRWRPGPSSYALGAGALLAAASLTFTGAALVARHDFDDTPFQRPAAEALSRMRWERNVAIVTGVAAAASVGLGLYLGLRAGPKVVAVVGPGGGLVSLTGSWRP